MIVIINSAVIAIGEVLGMVVYYSLCIISVVYTEGGNNKLL